MVHLYVGFATPCAVAFAPVPIPVGIGSKTDVFSSQARLGTDKKTARIFEVRAVFLSPLELVSTAEQEAVRAAKMGRVLSGRDNTVCGTKSVCGLHTSPKTQNLRLKNVLRCLRLSLAAHVFLYIHKLHWIM